MVTQTQIPTATIIPMDGDKQPPSPDLFEKAIPISITKGLVGLTKTVRSDAVEVNADKDMLHVSKDLYDSPELKAIISADMKIDEWLKWKCLPFPMKRSIYLLPKGLLLQVDEKLSEHKVKRDELVEKFIAKLDETIASAKERLKDLFDSTDYPTADAVRKRFTYSYQLLELGPSQQLKVLNKELYEREARKIQAQMIEGSKAIDQLLVKRGADVVAHLVERFTPAEEGKKKVFRNSSLDKVNEFISTFKEMNINDNKQLETIINQLKALTEGVTPDAIKTSEALQDAMLKGFTKIKSSLDELMVEQGERSIRLTD